MYHFCLSERPSSRSAIWTLRLTALHILAASPLAIDATATLQVGGTLCLLLKPGYGFTVQLKPWTS